MGPGMGRDMAPDTGRVLFIEALERKNGDILILSHRDGRAVFSDHRSGVDCHPITADQYPVTGPTRGAKTRDMKSYRFDLAVTMTPSAST